ncbi:hypothetical protein VNO78_06224 [Psophocarpus tetragonolobus]|uniref:Uncharacterized protein n=1 Tax=Psophocarpus tetragonolobus TaxID=3891 RepID=A0AAN9SS06_PSOTE
MENVEFSRVLVNMNMMSPISRDAKVIINGKSVLISLVKVPGRSDEWSELEVGETMASGDGTDWSMKDNCELEKSHEVQMEERLEKDGHDNSFPVALDGLMKGADLNEHFLNTEALNNERSLLHDEHENVVHNYWEGQCEGYSIHITFWE